MIFRSSFPRRTALPALVLPALVLLAVAACGSPAAPTTTSAASTATTASDPAVAVPEQLRFSAKTVDGADFSGESVAGKPAVLWFWAGFLKGQKGWIGSSCVKFIA